MLTSDEVLKWITPVSFFEIAIKHKIGKLPTLGMSPRDFFGQVKQDGYRILPLNVEHITAYDLLPFYDDHRDPFDRLILATALPIMSADGKFTRYKSQIDVIW